jgi:hypothetical protein
VKGDASNIGRTAESREKEVDRLKASIKTLEEAKKTLQADKAAVTGEKMNLELQLKSNGARLQVLEKENEKLRDKAGKIGEARSEAQLVSCRASSVRMQACRTAADIVLCRRKLKRLRKQRERLWLSKTSK